MNSLFVKSIVSVSFAFVSLSAGAQYTAPSSAPASPAKDSASKRLSDNDIRSYREGRRSCAKMDGAARETCRKELGAKYVDKQCRGLTDQKLDECLKNEYPGD